MFFKKKNLHIRLIEGSVTYRYPGEKKIAYTDLIQKVWIRPIPVLVNMGLNNEYRVPSSRVLVRGEEAGQSKLDKADKLGTKQLTEDGFLQLIVDKSAGAAKTKEKENKTPSPEVKKEQTSSKKKESAPVKKEAPKVEAKMAVKKEVKEEEEKPKVKTPLEEAIGFQIPKIPVPEAETIVSQRFLVN